MKTIPLTKGKVAIVDDEDYEELNKVKWFCSGNGYAIRNRPRSEKKVLGFSEFMHRRLMGVPPKSDLRVDHINGDILDNRKVNLRVCTHSNNMKNSATRKTNRTGLKGVCRVDSKSNTSKWKARINCNGITYYLGVFETPEEAHAAYKKAALVHHGEFANFG